MNTAVSDQTTKSAMSSWKRQNEDSLLCSKDKEDSVCFGQGVWAAGQTAAAGKKDLFQQIADEHPSLNSFDGHEHSSTSDPHSAKISVNDSDGSTRAATPECENPPSPGCYNSSMTQLHRSMSEETLDDNENSPLSAPSDFIRSGTISLKDAALASEDVLLNDASSLSVSMKGPAVPNLLTDRPRTSQQSFGGAQWPIQRSKQLTQSVKTQDQEHDVELSSSSETDEQFFREMLSDVDEPTYPFGLIKVDNGVAEVKDSRRILRQDLNERLHLQARYLGVNLAALCHVAWAQVVARTSGQHKVVFGTVLSGRQQAGNDSGRPLGLSTNILPFRCDIDQRSTLDCIQDTHSRLAALLKHEHASLVLAERCSSVPAEAPLFSGLLNYRHSSLLSKITPGASSTGIMSHEGWLDYPDPQFSSRQERTTYPVELAVDDLGTSLGITAHVMHPFSPVRICGYMQRALEELLDVLEGMKDTPIQKLEVLPKDEQQLLLKDWNSTQESYPDDQCLHHLFEQQVQRTPEAIAVVHEDQSLSYAELNNRANSLAHQLIALGVQPDDLVAICVERSPAMIIGILAILKAGGAYVPLDPFYASNRLKDIISDSTPKFLLADQVGREVLGETVLLAIPTLDPNTQEQYAAGNPQDTGLTPHHLAYIIYTSGSTGAPKGVMIEHQGVVNLVAFRSKKFQIHTNSRVLQFTSIGFDHSVSEIFSTLTCGASLHLVQDDLRLDRQRLWNLIQQSSITHVSFTPSLIQDCHDLPVLHSLQGLIVMGEGVPSTLPAVLRTIAPCSSIFNGYGPTETSIAAVVWEFQNAFLGDTVPIGRPLPNKSIYLLDSHGNPVPLGAVGEIYIGGVGVARGYLNLPSLTAERFISDPFSGGPDSRMYKTGDLARYLPDGNLVHLGRNDHQVKIRGFRIELGEIETQLTDHPLVFKAVVVALGEGSSKRLVAYMVMKDTEDSGVFPERSNATLRSHLATRLPEYMVPAAFVRLDAFPLTPNGKLDRRALPSPGDDDYARQDYEAPQGDVELALATIWSDLLHVKEVSRHDSFFALGGHSLLAIQMISRLHSIGHSISVRSLFESPSLSVLAQSIGQHQNIVIPANAITPSVARITPEMLPLIDLGQADIDRIIERVPGGMANIQDIYALSPLQDGILFHHLMAKNGDPYLLFVAMSFETRALLDRYLGVIQKIVNRHDILRTAFVYKNLSTPAQVVCRDTLLSITELKLDPAAGTVTDQLKSMFDPQSYRMDLTQAPLLCYIVAQERDGSWVLVELLHHLIGDHSTRETMQVEIQAFYNGQGDTLPPAQPYRNLIAQARLGVSQEEHEKFFKEMLAEVDTPSLPFGITDVHGNGAQVSESGRILPQDLNNRLRLQAKRLGVSVASLCHVAWALVIARTSGQEQVVFGTVLFGRMQAAAISDRAMGLFINTLPIRVDLAKVSVEESIQETHSRLVGLLEHEHASLALAQRCSSVGAGLPLFGSMLNYRHNSTSSEEEASADGMKLVEFHERTNYPLCLSVEDQGTSLGVTTQVIKPFEANRVCGYMQEALDSLAGALEDSPNIPVSRLEVLPKEELQLLLNDWNATKESYPEDLCLHHLFEQQVQRTPQAVAVVHKDQSLSYAELNNRANSLAYRLIDLGVQPESLVAICVERSPEMIIGILAILKAGGAYVPLDPSHASDRLQDILCDASPVCVVADQAGLRALGSTAISSSPVVDPHGTSTHPLSNAIIPSLNSHHLAYIIYTSGTTGKPKGVMIEHQGIVNYVTSQQQTLQIQPSSRMTQSFSIGFDASVLEIFCTLCFGGTLHLLQDDVRMDLSALWRYLDQHHITHVMLTPTVLQDCGKLASLNTLLKLFICGETLPGALVPKLLKLAPRGTIYNMYGPTETTVVATIWRCSGDDMQETIPIGRQLGNRSIYLLDEYGSPVPLGAIGEIFIGGIGVARGYLNRPDLTAEKFLANPFADKPGARMYRTGDLGKYLPDGNLLHLGRSDHQVKIRGFRIELGEIETRLHEHSLVSEAVVLADGKGSAKRLVAYVIMTQIKDNGLQSIAALRSHLATRLPEYMVPSVFVRLDVFPMTPNGKLDRAALPAPGDNDFARQDYEAPQGEIELALASIWADLLRLTRVSRNDSFFALGGHSLLAVRMINRVASLGAKVPLAALFGSPRLFDFATQLKLHLGQDSITLPPIVSVPRSDMMPLSFAQQRMWFLAQLDGVSGTYHVPLAIRLRGTLDRDAWQRAMDALYARHEALRAVFVDVHGQPHMKILAPEGVPVQHIDLRHVVDGNWQLETLVAKDLNTPFDLSQGPLIRSVLIQTAEDEYVLSLTQHHIISDGWSMSIMTRELSELYTAYCGGYANTLPPLLVQYPDYTAWQRQWFSKDRLKEQADYWRTTLTGAPVLSELPTDRPRPARQSFAGSRIPVTFNADLTASLNRLSQEHGVTMFMIILTAWSAVLSRLSGQDDIVIGTPIANRGRQEMETMMGLFVNTLALRVDLSAEPTVRSLLARVRERTLAAYENQDLPFEQVVEIVQPPRKMEHTPLFQVMFSWQNNESSEWKLPGLQASRYKMAYDVVQFDLELDLYEEDGHIVGSLRHSTALFDQTTIERYVGYLGAMLQALIDDVDQPINSIDILSPAERGLVLQTWNATEHAYPTHECMHRLFERQVERTPQAIALVYENDSLSYAELNGRANRLAHYLIELGIRPDSLVAICVERSLAMVVGSMAILKAGGAFVPLDPAYASERLRTILSDAAPPVLLADAAGLKSLGRADLSSMTVVDPNKSLSHSSSNTAVAGLTSRHLAYIIYTSGSTGKPKGVMLEHRGLANLCHTHTRFCGIHERSRLMQFASFSFDASVWDIMLPLSSGAALYLPPDLIRMDRDALWEYMRCHSITHASFTPSFLQDGKDLPLLKNHLTLILGGEALSPSLLHNLIRQGITVINDYGPTEVTVSAATWRCPLDFEDTVVPIGRPVIHSRLYVLDAHRRPVPLGAVGELYVGGVAVARGYLNRPKLTSEMFVADPYTSEAESRMYRTGDLVRYLPDGNLMYLGRKDSQVKIRGFRVELGEIEACLMDHPAVSEAVIVVLGEASDKRLIAYVVSEPIERLAQQLRAHVAANLPRYMIPEAYVRLQAMPLTSNDKLDRGALPAPNAGSCALDEYDTPDSQVDPDLDPTQLAIHTIWKQLLPSSPTWIPLTESFFNLGGHSILATRLIFELRRVCDVNVPLSMVFQSSTIESMAMAVTKARMDALGELQTHKDTLSDNTAASSQAKAVDYSADFEALLRTEIQAVYPRLVRKDKVDYQTFFLTGATGFLGAFILSNLMVSNPTARVICLARASSEEKAMERVRSCGVAYLTWNEDWATSGRLSAVKGDLVLDRFGLAPEVWDTCCRDVDIIIHNGAAVSGVLPYNKVRAANVLGTLQGIKMASTYHTKSFHFVSSTSVLDTEHYRRLSHVLAQTGKRGIPETDDLEGARQGLASGYAQSKWVSEKLVMASNKNGLPATIIRPGYIVGHTRTGATNTGDIIWRLIKGCVEIGSAPTMNAPVDFCPVDYVAQCVVSVATTPGTEAGMVYQVTHSITNPFRFDEFFDVMIKYGYKIRTVDDQVWRTTLTAHVFKSQDTVLFPLLHIHTDHLPGASNSPEMSDGNTRRVLVCQPGFDTAPRMSTELIGTYLSYMVKTGFLSRPTVRSDIVLALPVLEEEEV